MDSISRNAGGMFDAGRRLAQGLCGLGEEVRVFGVEDGHSQADMGAWAPAAAELHRCRFDRRLGYAPTLGAGLHHFDADVVHTQGLWTYTSAAAGGWSRRAGRPECIHPHGMLDPWALKNSAWKKRLVLRLFERRHLQRASCLRALCESELESIRALGLVNPVCIIPNGVDLPEPSAASVREPWMQGQKVLLYLGRLHPKKGLLPLLQAWADLYRAGGLEGWVLAVAGWDQGGHEEELKSQADALALPWLDVRQMPKGSAPLVFTGPRFGEEKDRLYAASEAFVLPSLSEGLPMVILDAWAHGKPVVMTAACNLPEGFAAGAAIEAKLEADDLTVGIRTLLAASDVDRLEMGAKGRQLVRDKFTWGRVAQQMHQVNEWLVHGGAVPDCVQR
ncbi:glycosyltransferase [Prosthecobacter algae]|uniref:Glycosyltransferase n=1 Tax=Prosthecobacter algae TaxID=1144682 RepID=A0ABP9NW55_9BACT